MRAGSAIQTARLWMLSNSVRLVEKPVAGAFILVNQGKEYLGKWVTMVSKTI